MELKTNAAAVFSNLEKVCQKQQRPQNSVNVIAVTKYVDSYTVKELLDKTPVRHIGENRVEMFLDKYHALKDYDVTWHLIGSLQRRKVKDVIDFVDYFHALDSVKLAAEIQKRATKPIKCFLQVNVSGEESKHGFASEEIDSVLEELAAFDKIVLVGLMTMAPFEASREELVAIFSETQRLQKELASRELPGMPFTELSMGMSGDYPEAIAHGATYVRIGTAFFK